MLHSHIQSGPPRLHFPGPRQAASKAEAARRTAQGAPAHTTLNLQEIRKPGTPPRPTPPIPHASKAALEILDTVDGVTIVGSSNVCHQALSLTVALPKIRTHAPKT